jgi:copper chaperone NosL
MSIVDQRFGGEIVTDKGKIYKFDAIECLINYLDKMVKDESKLKLILTNTHDSPGVLLDVRDCRYLRSENMPSPMGMFLNPFADTQKAIKSMEENSGTIMNWQELRDEFAKD